MATHTGAMVALIPTAADAARLAVEGGEPTEELHLTLFYLGEAAGYDERARASIVDRLRSLVEDVLRPDYDLPVMAGAFAVDIFNPGADGSCVVLGVTGSELEMVWDLAADSLDEVEAARGDFQLPEQHQPWTPHITLVYTADPMSVVGELLDRVGPVTFDRLRVVFAGDVVDVPLRPVTAAKRYDPHQLRLPGGPHGGEWARAGNTAESFASTMPELGEYDEFSLAEVPAVHAEVHRAFDAQHGGLTASVNDQASKMYRDEHGRAVVRAEGVITNADGKVVGSFRRNLYPETGEVHNDTLALASTEQGAGFAQRYAERAEAVLAEQGFTHATVSATGVGGYAWAKRYGWDPSKPTAAGDVPDRLASIVNRYPLTDADRAKVEGWLRAFRQPDQSQWPTPKTLANFGKNTYFRLSGDRTVWPGKDVMIDSSWSGVRDLRPAAKSRRGGAKRYDSHQIRDPHTGEWINGPGAGLATGKAALRSAGARLPDREPGKDDTDAQLSFDQDPGWSDRARQGTSRAVRLYRNSTYRKINGYLRGDGEDEYLHIRESVDAPAKREHIVYDHVVLIDQGMEASQLSAPVQLWRGIHDGAATFGDAWNPDNMTGAEWDELGFPSTTADPAVGRMFGGDVVMRLHVPKGIGAIQLDGWKSQDRPNAEAELLLQRNLRMRVVGDSPASGGYQLIDGTWVDTGPKVYRTLDVEVEAIPEDDE